MPRILNSKNSNYYHYKVNKYNDSERTSLIEEGYFKTQEQIKDKYSLCRSNIYYIQNNITNSICSKHGHFTIIKLCPPEPVYAQVVIEK